MLALDGQWFACDLESGGRTVWSRDASIEYGMSGSPILGPEGVAVGAISTGDGPNPLLMDVLPGWLLRATASASL